MEEDTLKVRLEGFKRQNFDLILVEELDDLEQGFIDVVGLNFENPAARGFMIIIPGTSSGSCRGSFRSVWRRFSRIPCFQ